MSYLIVYPFWGGTIASGSSDILPEVTHLSRTPGME